MPKPDINSVLECLARREITARQATRRLVALGLETALATEAVHVALGGSDLVEKGTDGTERYQPSGRSVSEVAMEMELTVAQSRAVELNLARGWTRADALLMVVEGTDDVCDASKLGR